MKTKIVYIVVCDETNFYLEQALLSIYSLRIYNPTAYVCIVTDTKSEEFIKKNQLLNNQISVDELTSIDIPTSYNNKQKSRFLKTNLRQFISGAYLFIDTDTIVCADLSAIDNFNFDIGAVLDTHITIQDHLSKCDIEKFAKLYHWNVEKCNLYFNSGVMYVKDNSQTHEFYKMWNKYWLLGSKNHEINIDQPSLAKANEEAGFIITELDGEYNCQINENGLKYLSDAKILHYFASNINASYNSFIFAHNDIYKDIREIGFSKQLISLLNKPKRAFNDKCIIIAGTDSNLYKLPINRIAIKISRQFPSINRFIRKLSLLRNIGK